MIVLVLFSLTSLFALPVEKGPPFVIASPSLGGYIRNYANARDVLNHYHIPLEIRASCASSCTLYLAVDDVCIDGNAEFIFHTSKDEKADKFLMDTYPDGIKKWIESKGGLKETPLKMEFIEAKKFVPVCE